MTEDEMIRLGSLLTERGERASFAEFKRIHDKFRYVTHIAGSLQAGILTAQITEWLVNDGMASARTYPDTQKKFDYLTEARKTERKDVKWTELRDLDFDAVRAFIENASPAPSFKKAAAPAPHEASGPLLIKKPLLNRYKI